MNKYTAEPLLPDATYHIYNHANGFDKLFMGPENYEYFLRRYHELVSPVADTLCYCLLPNHFHLIVRIRDCASMKNFFSRDKSSHSPRNPSQDLQGLANTGKDLEGLATLEGLANLEVLVGRQFGNFFNAYAKAFNKVFNRKGSLFTHTFKRRRVKDETYLRNLV